MKVLLNKVCGILGAFYFVGLAGFAHAADFVANQIPLSPQMAQPHDAWVTLAPGVILAFLSSLIWIFGKKG
jgi:hypothetical protein